MKLICGHLVPDCGEIKLFGKEYTDAGVRARVGALIKNAGCFPNSSVWDNLMMQAINLGLENPDDEIERVLRIVRMEESAKIKFKSCSLGMKQRIGIAMALLGDPALLILVMTTMMDGSVSVNPQTGVETVMEGFENTWQIIGSVSGASSAMAIDMKSMCNINLRYFFVAVPVGIFVTDDFRSGYAKNLFAVRAKKADSIISKTLVCFVGGALFSAGLGAISGKALSKTSLV